MRGGRESLDLFIILSLIQSNKGYVYEQPDLTEINVRKTNLPVEQ